LGEGYGLYSSFGITVDRKRELKWLFSQEKATLHTVNEDHTNSETALARTSKTASVEGFSPRGKGFSIICIPSGESHASFHIAQRHA
jgi:hypothetical protein